MVSSLSTHARTCNTDAAEGHCDSVAHQSCSSGLQGRHAHAHQQRARQSDRRREARCALHEGGEAVRQDQRQHALVLGHGGHGVAHRLKVPRNDSQIIESCTGGIGSRYTSVSGLGSSWRKYKCDPAARLTQRTDGGEENEADRPDGEENAVECRQESRPRRHLEESCRKRAALDQSDNGTTTSPVYESESALHELCPGSPMATMRHPPRAIRAAIYTFVRNSSTNSARIGITTMAAEAS